ncbi:adenosine deaminase [Micromonospora sp. WMMD1128]|uniref:adenosine deaminase n=1 Tax=unclassified Micromonospora TaxID=2617518 RepID=UPI00248CC4D3|nr:MULTISPECIES: adenosine deaminase [unclassified Micromonospora]WBB75819.1 adenosine deaminase [Micromonospora sp. WMMD1128]WFE36391.1 adenosine deaminase [Micromonospora sp. WMMD975]
MSPKIELHVHLEGTIRPRTLLEIARRNGSPLPARTEVELARHYRFVDFAHFIEVWIATTNCLRTRADFHRVVVDYAAEAARHGAVYVEGIFSPAERVRRGVRWADIFGGYADGAVEAYERHGVLVRFTPDIDRELEPALAEECARQAVRYRDRGVVGFGIGGRESAGGLAVYARAVAIARDGGLGFVPHAGEATGVESIREALGYDPVRLRHGIRAADDPRVSAEIVERGVVLDVCPTSNLRTQVVGALDDHPLPRLRAAGVACSIGTDDPAMFDTDLSREYRLAARLGVSAADAYAAGVAGALCDGATRVHLERLGRSAFAPASAP